MLHGLSGRLERRLPSSNNRLRSCRERRLGVLLPHMLLLGRRQQRRVVVTLDMFGRRQDSVEVRTRRFLRNKHRLPEEQLV